MASIPMASMVSTVSVFGIAVAGDFRGEYTEADFDTGQQLPTPYHQTKFEAELLVRF